MEEKRRFKRIPMDGKAELSCSGKSWSCQMLDISLKGALISRPADWPLQQLSHCTLTLRLDDDIAIVMEGNIVHGNGAQLGFHCAHINLDSISHLKRLVELNLGSEEILERELTELFHNGNG